MRAREAKGKTEGEVNEEVRAEFLALISHELRAPTTAILGWIELIGAGQADGERLARGMEVIKRSARLQTKLIEQLLDFARAGTAQLVINPRHVSLAPVLYSSVEMILPLAGAKAIKVRTHVDFAAAIVLGEPDRLQQIFVNLLTNAVKFTSEGGHVEVRLARGGASCAEVTVTDDGSGINADFLPFVFERFRRADAMRMTERQGLGLGLYIARTLVELHGGTISAHSPGEGLGATFTVLLPIGVGGGGHTAQRTLEGEPSIANDGVSESRRKRTTFNRTTQAEKVRGGDEI
jgi:signal transduction histidine kinase